ncbi:ATP-binding protein [Sulfidibacter corallicola]|uniref:ATP-binding protein n=1 Tax=Sulfidibacter corallicola TaxID=2818388 RepID=A0A8A4TPR1_SULCO|nr:ATP-binding protein [Sulfidibacter corallicola]QTD48565.1 ATP-binding protein [Sulfidibacter corallicola]
MQIKTLNAANLFFPNPKFELVYFEAIANSIDAGATEIFIENVIDPSKGSKSIEVEISDNGLGFNDKNFQKFSNLLEVESEDHNGFGRLVFLKYFDDVDIVSVFSGGKREFRFNKDFKDECLLSEAENESSNTSLRFFNYNRGRIKSYETISPASLRVSILRHFFPILYEKKIKRQDLKISFSQKRVEPDGKILNVEEEQLDVASLDDLKKAEFPATGLDLLNTLEILYSIKKVKNDTSIITSICSDGRAIQLSLINKSQLPSGYELIFVVYSDFFTGRSNFSRQHLEMSDYETRTLKSILVEKLSKILVEEIPEIQIHNEKTVSFFLEHYPHLSGYFDRNSIGLIEKSRVIEDAQKKFFAAQREILEADSINQERYEKSIEISSRLLTEYILYRTLIINKLKEFDDTNSEAEIHNTIVPMKKVLQNERISEHIFFNNAWLLDDKYMNFRTILSDCDLKRLAGELEIVDNEFKTEKRPDITIIFSSDIDSSPKVDVVVVELKKLGLSLAKKEEVVSQLRQRARKLVLHYPGKIQRMWFYGIVDFDDEFKRSLLEDQFIELYSSGNLFYKEFPIMPSLQNRTHTVPTGIFVMDYQAFIHDAEARNKTFLEILKSGFGEFAQH